MSSARAFATLSSSLLARKGGARPAMRSPLQSPVGSGADPLSDLGWNDMGQDPVPSADQATADPLLARKPEPEPEPAVILPVEVAVPARPASLALVGARPIVRRTSTAAFTLRLDPARHFRLRVACALRGRSAQSLVTAAIDHFLDLQPEPEARTLHPGTSRIA